MSQNALGQSDCRIFKSTVYIEQNHEKTLRYGTLNFFISKMN